jgi:DNA-directed RNA polymerase alpha subunit
MAVTKKTLKICPKGHEYSKSSDCPTCPVCEAEKKPGTGFLSVLSAPARRALENNGITTLKQLSNYSEKAILEFHGMGKASLPKLCSELEEKGLSFKSGKKS